MITENGWPSCGPDQLERNPIPGTDDVVAFQQGQPNIILKAFAADLNWYVESVYNSRGAADEGGWTAGNSVPTSNHLGGTAMDYNWDDHPMGNEYAGWDWSAIAGNAEITRVRELLDYYEGTVFWGNDWDSPKDSMHFQMGYGTFGNPHTQDFIDRKIDPKTGFSKFKADHGTPAANVDALQVLSQAMGPTIGVDYAPLLPAVQQCLRACDCATVARIAMWMAQIGTESAGLKYMEEIADGSEYNGRTDLGNTQPGDGPRFKGRGPIQVTGRHNYTVLSQWAFDQGLVPNPTFFVDSPDQLASNEFGFIGVTWYWTTQRPLNDAADAQDVVTATHYVNGGEHGLPDRKARFAKCMSMGQRLLALVTGEDDFVGVNTDRLNQAVDKILGSWPSRSIYRDNDDLVDDTVGMLLNEDGSIHEFRTENSALLGDPEAIAKVKRTAEGKAVEQHPNAIARAKFVYSKCNAPVIAAKAPTHKQPPKKAAK